MLALESFATSASSAVYATRSVEDEKLRLSIASSERERQRWARELHDETLQELGALNVMLESAMQVDDGATVTSVPPAIPGSDVHGTVCSEAGGTTTS